jgi:signal transduction histidine kinase
MTRHFDSMIENDIATRARHIAASVTSENSACESCPSLILPALDAFESPGVYVQVLGQRGGILGRSANLEGQKLPWSAKILALAQSGQSITYNGELQGIQLQIHILPIQIAEQRTAFVQVAMSTRQFDDALARLRFILVAGGITALFLAGAVGWAIARRALRPISDITETARAIALSQGFSRRLDHYGSRDEVGLLVVTFNEMLASLEAAYVAQRRFAADASHELRAPLTTIRGNLELLERVKDMPPAEQAHAISHARQEADHLSHLVSDLLSLAQADAGQGLQMQPVELDTILLDAYRQAVAMASDVHVSIDKLEQIIVSGDSERLRQLLIILVDNALKYTPGGGQVTLSLTREGDWAAIVVRDTGIGIDTEDLLHIFDRFYRADGARAQDPGGSGLGLSIAKWIVEDHGGEIYVESTPGRGSTFTARLPLSGD